MLIIIEGVDCTGKSTLANALAERARADGDNVRLIHMGPPKHVPIVEYELTLSGYKPGAGETIICDRWHLGADVYGPLKRLDDGLDGAVRWHIEAFLKSRGALLVHAQPTSTEEHLALMRERGEDYINEDEAVLVARAFQTVVGKSMLNKIEGSIPYNIDTIYERARTAERAMSYVASFSSYVGPSRPAHLLLGDKKNRNNPTDIDLKTEGAFIPYKQSSGKYLIKSLLLTASDIELRRIGMANANEEDVARLWDALYNPTVIALGAEAAKACEAAYVPHKRVEHPAYVRRFMTDDIVSYGRRVL